MDQDWIVTIWGVRGAMPAACPEFMGFGGNTSCVSVDCGEDLVVFDAGTGLSSLGRQLEPGRHVHIFLGHVHMDHLLGLYLFPPLHDTGAEVHLYGEARDGVPFRRQLERIFGAPYWPVGFDDFEAAVTVHEIGPDQAISLPGGRTVHTMRGNHPNLGLLYRLEDSRRRVVYTLDCELTDALRPRLQELCRGADLMIWDANYTSEDLAKHPGWGHSSWEQGAEFARETGVKLTLMSHFDQSYSDAFLERQERLARGPGIQFARERMEVRL